MRRPLTSGKIRLDCDTRKDKVVKTKGVSLKSMRKYDCVHDLGIRQVPEEGRNSNLYLSINSVSYTKELVSSIDFPLLFNILLGVIMTAILGTWVYLLLYSIKSYRRSPVLTEAVQKRLDVFPKVSVMVPALNEEQYIAKCLDSLVEQDYPNFEIIAINDSSTDRTGQIMDQYSKNDHRLVVIDADHAPEGWVGKNWACYQGYLRSSGDILLFTDADTVHSSQLMTRAITY